MVWNKAKCELSLNTPRHVVEKVNSWVHYGAYEPLTAREAKQLLKANCTIDENGCWLWNLNTFKNGYGRLSCRAVRAIGFGISRVHIVAYLLWNGEVPEGKFVCHSCDVKRCFNPKHLWLGTNHDNQKDAVNKGVFAAYWTKERRAAKGILNSGAGNPMYGRSGTAAPCYGRVGALHPMFGTHHTSKARAQISASCKATFAAKRCLNAS